MAALPLVLASFNEISTDDLKLGVLGVMPEQPVAEPVQATVAA